MSSQMNKFGNCPLCGKQIKPTNLRTVKRINLEQNTVDVEIARGVVITVAKGYVFADATAQTPNA